MDDSEGFSVNNEKIKLLFEQVKQDVKKNPEFKDRLLRRANKIVCVMYRICYNQIIPN